jgi:hypothetical protein
MLFLCALTISVKAQSPTQNYVLSKDVLDVDGTHSIIKPLGLGNIVRRNIHFEDVYGTK